MRRLARFAAVLGIAAIALWQVDLAAAAQYFHWHLLTATVMVQPLIVCGFLVAGLRLRTLLGQHQTRYLPALKATILATGMNVVLPGRLSELLKVTYLHDHARIPLSAVLGAVFLDRLIDVIMLGLTAMLSVSVLMSETNTVVIATMISALGILVLLPRLEKPIVRLCRLLPWISLRNFVQDLHASVVMPLRTPAIYKALAYGMAIWTLSFLNVALFLHLAGDMPIGLSGVLFVFVLSVVGGTIPALPGGFGTYEAAVVFGLTRYGITAEQALPVALALHISQLLFGLAGALFIAASERMGISAFAQRIRDYRGKQTHH